MHNAATLSRPVSYQWLFFDADGTLFDYDRSESVALANAFAQINVAFDSSWVPIYRRINIALWKDLLRGQISPDVLIVRRFELLLEMLRIDYPAFGFSEVYL